MLDSQVDLKHSPRTYLRLRWTVNTATKINSTAAAAAATPMKTLADEDEGVATGSWRLVQLDEPSHRWLGPSCVQTAAMGMSS